MNIGALIQRERKIEEKMEEREGASLGSDDDPVGSKILLKNEG